MSQSTPLLPSSHTLRTTTPLSNRSTLNLAKRNVLNANNATIE